jgi:hypothetical protein
MFFPTLRIAAVTVSAGQPAVRKDNPALAPGYPRAVYGKIRNCRRADNAAPFKGRRETGVQTSTAIGTSPAMILHAHGAFLRIASGCSE